MHTGEAIPEKSMTVTLAICRLMIRKSGKSSRRIMCGPMEMRWREIRRHRKLLRRKVLLSSVKVTICLKSVRT